MFATAAAIGFWWWSLHDPPMPAPQPVEPAPASQTPIETKPKVAKS